MMKYKLTKNNHLYLKGRFYATQLMYLDENNLPVDKLIAKVQKCHELFRKLILKGQVQCRYCFEYVICPILIIMGRINEAPYFIIYAKNQYSNKIADIDNGLYESLKLFEVLATFKSGKIKAAEKLFSRIHPTRFNYLNKKICMILYLILGERLNKGTPSNLQQLIDLIGETGFTRLAHLKHTM